VTRRSIVLYLLIIGLLLVGMISWYAYSFLSQPPAEIQVTPTSIQIPPEASPANTAQPTLTVVPTPVSTSFDGQRAYADVLTQVSFGARVPESEGHAQIQEWMQGELESAGWQVEIQASESLGHPIENIVARRSEDAPQILLGAHYDTRMFADSDPDPAQHTNFVPGANDGASGVAVLLELARSLPDETVPVWLVFFDAEDNGRIEGWDWILGSREFVKNNSMQPRAAIIVDMIGDADLNIYKERNSNPNLTDEIWAVAEGLGYESKFIPEYKHSMLDDHTPFIEAGIPAVDIIDFDYPYWHTVQDTPDKVSAESLQIVGETLQVWIMQQSEQP
jgi:glutaminyl-peptide cyclotransferase